jgi:hypothetical protein
MRSLVLGMSMLAVGCALTRPVVAEEVVAASPDAKIAQERTEARSAPKVVRVQLVLMRYQGEKKTASIPYTLVASTDGEWARLRMGVNVPIVVVSGEGTSYQYKDVGTNMDCRVRASWGDRYGVALQVEDSSIYGKPMASAARDTAIAPDKAMFRSFKVTLSLVLRDGQTLQTVASTDPVTGEVVKIDVTLNVVK